MHKKPDVIAESTILFHDTDKKLVEVTIRIRRPVMGAGFDDAPIWECHFEFEGLYDLEKPVQGVSSFDALIRAISDAYSLLRDEVSRGRIYETGGLLGKERLPADGMSLVELFGMDVISG